MASFLEWRSAYIRLKEFQNILHLPKLASFLQLPAPPLWFVFCKVSSGSACLYADVEKCKEFDVEILFYEYCCHSVVSEADWFIDMVLEVAKTTQESAIPKMI